MADNEDGTVDECALKGKHGRDKRYLIQNQMVYHPVPTIKDKMWVLPKDGLPSISKGWYDKENGAFNLTVRYRVCFVPTPVEIFLIPNTNHPE